MRKILKYLFLLLLVSLVCGGGVVLVSNIKVTKISCENQVALCSENLQVSINNLQKKQENIFQTRNDLTKLLKQDGSVLDYSVRFELPLAYKVYVIERKPVVAFLLTDGYFGLVDKDGFLVSRVKETALPKVTSAYDLDRDHLTYIAKLISRLYTFYGGATNYAYNVSSAQVTKDGVEVNNLKGKKVIFPLSGDVDEVLGALSIILSRLPSMKEASTIRIIDLRFKNPVLRQ